MPRRALVSCSCGRLVPVGERCDHGRAAGPFQAGGDWQAWYSLPAWKRIRRVQLTGSPWCALCLALSLIHI